VAQSAPAFLSALSVVVVSAMAVPSANISVAVPAIPMSTSLQFVAAVTVREVTPVTKTPGGMIDPVVDSGSCQELRMLAEKLELCECADRGEEIRVLMKILGDSIERGGTGDLDKLQKRILWLLRKFAHRKYRDRFENSLEELRAALGALPTERRARDRRSRRRR